MTNTDLLEARIAIVAPSRAGKTTLLTCLLQQGHDLVAGTEARFEADGESDVRYKDAVSLLRSAFKSGEFNAGVVAGTEDVGHFRFSLKATRNEKRCLWLAFKDFPGGWLSEKNNSWNEIKNWLEDAHVLILPIDTPALMQAETQDEKKHREKSLEVAQITEFARAWAKQRSQTNCGPSLLIFVPVKCERYFKGGIEDTDATQLEASVKSMYEPVLEAVKSEFKSESPSKRLTLLYAPVQTMGKDVDLKRAEWLKNDADRWYCKETFLAKSQGKWSPLWADDLLREILRSLDNARGDFFKESAASALAEFKQQISSVEYKIKNLKKKITEEEAKRPWYQFWGTPAQLKLEEDLQKCEDEKRALINLEDRLSKACKDDEYHTQQKIIEEVEQKRKLKKNRSFFEKTIYALFERVEDDIKLKNAHLVVGERKASENSLEQTLKSIVAKTRGAAIKEWK
jgi:hypothetical protein